jgi:ABC-type nickel/cobalt efflux system permease component RcnA
MGIAGGLVPSPSALIVLLGAVGLGRTAFGVLLVLAYGAGMAAMLTAAGWCWSAFGIAGLRVHAGHWPGSRRWRRPVPPRWFFVSASG